jgi:hypothetical protein
MFVDKTLSLQTEQYIMSSLYSSPVNNNAFSSSDSEEEVDDAAIVHGNFFYISDEEGNKTLQQYSFWLLLQQLSSCPAATHKDHRFAMFKIGLNGIYMFDS